MSMFDTFFDLLAKTYKDRIPVGTTVEAQHDPVADQILAKYKRDGETHTIVFNIDRENRTFTEVGVSPRNEFEQNIPLEEEDKEVPLTLGVGGPVVGTVKLTKDGAILGNITDEEFSKKLQGNLGSFAIGRRDPAEKYRAFVVRPQHDE